MSKRGWALLGVACFGVGALVTASVGHTYAAYSDFQVVHVSVSAGTWNSTPATPSECAGMTFDKVIILTSNDDVWDATAHGDKTKSLLVFGLGGNDVITGGVKDDCLVGGDGNDTLNGGNGHDVLVGGTGNDTLTGNNAKDKLYGGADDDTLYGGNAPDVLDGGGGNNVCYGGHAPDLVDCTPGATP